MWAVDKMVYCQKDKLPIYYYYVLPDFPVLSPCNASYNNINPAR